MSDPRQGAVRATDGLGSTQPLGQAWDAGGFADTMVKRVPVMVRSV